MKKKKIKQELIQALEGLDQTFVASNGKKRSLRDILGPGDWWELKKNGTNAIIVTHNAVKKIADIAGIRTDPEYTILTQPDVRNNYQNTWQVRICGKDGRCTTEIGESNRSNLGSRGRNNPANMAQKRAYDRAVFRHLGITGFLGEDELPDEEDNKEVNKLTYEEQQAIATLINEIIGAKSKKDLTDFRAKMKTAKGLTDGQLNVLRNLWKKTWGGLEKTF